MNQEVPGRLVLRVVWAGLMVVFAAYVAVALGLGGSGLLDAFSSWVSIALVLGAAGAARAARLHRRGPARAVARARGERRAVGGRRAGLRDRVLRGPGPRARTRRWPTRSGSAPTSAAAAGIVLVLRSRLRRAFHPTMWLDAAIGATTIAALTATLAFDPVLADTGGATLEVATDLAYPLADLGLLALVVDAARADRLAARAGLGGVRGRARAAGGLRRALRARDRARHRRPGHAARAGVAGRDAAARLRRLAAAVGAGAQRRPARARVHLPRGLHVARARRPRLRPLPRHQHARRRARRDRDRAGRRRGWRCRSSTTCGCCGAPATTRSPTRSPGCRTGARSSTTSRGCSRPAARSQRRTLAPLRPRRLQALQRRLRAPGRRRAAAAPVGRARRRRRGPRPGLPARRRRVLPAARGRRQRQPCCAPRPHALEARGDGFDVTASYGRVALPEDAADSEEALHLADRRMYAAKESRPSSAGPADPQRPAQGALRARAGAARALERRHGPRARRRAAARACRPTTREIVARAAELHDIGKMAIPDAILSKPGPLDDREWRFMRRHTIIGEDILNAAPALQPVAALVRASHERWDGTGYPDGTAGEEIPEGARIVAVCDAFSAMVQDRPYQPGLTVQRGGRRDRALRGRALRPPGRRRRSRPRSAPRPCPREAGLAPALVALACLGAAPAAAQGAPGDIAIADEGNWFGSSGRVLRLPSGGAASLLAGGRAAERPVGGGRRGRRRAAGGRRGRRGGVLDRSLRHGRHGRRRRRPAGPRGHRAGAGRQGLRLRPPARRGAAARPRHGRPVPRRRSRATPPASPWTTAGKLLVTDGVAAPPHRSRDGRDHDRRGGRAARRPA